MSRREVQDGSRNRGLVPLDPGIGLHLNLERCEMFLDRARLVFRLGPCDFVRRRGQHARSPKSRGLHEVGYALPPPDKLVGMKHAGHDVANLYRVALTS